MTIVFEVATTDAHFAQIIHLQQQNLARALSAEHQAQHGFVFAEHTLPLLHMMATHLPQVIAVHEGSVIGYNEAVSTYHDGQELWHVVVWDLHGTGSEP